MPSSYAEEVNRRLRVQLLNACIAVFASTLGILSLVSLPSMPSIAIIWPAIAAAGIVFYQHSHVHVTRPNIDGVFGWMKHLFLVPNASLMAMHIASCIITAQVYHSLLPSTSFHLAVKDASHWTLNPDATFVYPHAIFIGLLYSLRHTLLLKSHVKFPKVRISRWLAWRHRLPTILMTSLGRGIAWTVLFVILHPLMVPIFERWLSFIGNPSSTIYDGFELSRFFAWTRPGMIGTAWLTAALCITLLELSHMTLQVFLTHPVHVAMHSMPPYSYLASGLASDDPLVQMHALVEVYDLCTCGVDAGLRFRRGLFADVSNVEGVTRRAWQELVDPCMKIIATFEKCVDAGGSKPLPEPPKPAPAATPIVQSVAPISPFAVHPRKIAMGTPIVKAPYQTLSAHVSQAAGALASDVSHKATTGTKMRLSKALIRTRLEASTRTRSFWDAVASKWRIVAWFRERNLIEKNRNMFGDYQRVVLAIQIVARLLSASVHEDVYGSAQRDLERCLTSMTHIVTSIEKRSKTAMKGMRPKGIWRGQVIEQPTIAVLRILKLGIHQVAEAFRDTSLSPNFRELLLPYLDYHE